MKLIDCKAIAREINATTAGDVALLAVQDVQVTLAILQPTNDEAAAWYARSIASAADKVGINTIGLTMHDATKEGIIKQLAKWGDDPSVHGILCLTPLPEGVHLAEVAMAIPLAKDVDGANIGSLALLLANAAAIPPATAAAVMDILAVQEIPLKGLPVTVVGRSLTVGKPAAIMLLSKDATVTIAHSHSMLTGALAEADVIVTAAGKAGLITGDMVFSGTTIIDVGTNPLPDGGFVGDVDLASFEGEAHANTKITPVPGGVGTVTVARLLSHTVLAAKLSLRDSEEWMANGGDLTPGVMTITNNSGAPIPVYGPPTPPEAEPR